MHNEMRHHPDKTDFKKCFMRVCGEVHLRPCLQSVWRDIFGWSPRQAPRRQQWQFVLATPKCHTDSVDRLIFQFPTNTLSSIIHNLSVTRISHREPGGDPKMPTLANCHIVLMDLFFIALGTCIASQGCFPSWDGGAYASVTCPPLAHLHICSCSASPCAFCALAHLDCDGVIVRWLSKKILYMYIYICV